MQVLSGSDLPEKPANFIRSLDVRTRMAVCLLASVGIIFIQSWYCLTLLFAASFIYAAAHGRLTVTGAAYAAVLAIFAIAMGCVKIMLMVWPDMGQKGVAPFINPFLRIMILVNVILALALSCRVQEFMNTLKALRLPFFIYLPTTVMVRFIPSFINDVKQISQSMKTKGYSLSIFSMTVHPLLTMRLLFVPVVIRALRSADELSVAAELKGLGTSQAVHTSTSVIGLADILTMGAALMLMGACFL